MSNTISIPLTPEYREWLKIELHRTDDPIIATSKTTQLKFLVKSIDQAKKVFVVEIDAFVNRFDGIVSEMPGTTYNRGKEYPVENFDIMPFSEYLKKQEIQFKHKESVGFKNIELRVGEKEWTMQYQADKKEWYSTNNKTFKSLEEINNLLNSGEARLYSHTVRGDELFRWKPFTIPAPKFKWHDMFESEGKFYELLYAMYSTDTPEWVWHISISDAGTYHSEVELSEKKLESYKPIERWKVREADLLRFLKNYDTPTWDTSLYFIADSITQYLTISLPKFPEDARRKYEQALNALLARVKARQEEEKHPKKPEEKPKFVIENPFGVDLSKSIVPYPELQKPKEPLQLRNRVDGIELVVGTKTYLVRHLEAKGFIETTDYYTRLYHQPYNATVPPFHQDYDRILNYFIKNNFVPVKPLPIVPDTSSADYKAGYNIAIADRIYAPVPAWTDQGKVDYSAGYTEGKRILYEQDTKSPIFGQPIKKQQVTFDAPVFGQPIKPEKSEPVFFGDTRQRATEQEQKKRAQEGKRLRNQQTLTSAVSTSHRLTEFEVKEKPVMQPERIKSLPFKKPIPFVTPGRYPPKRIIIPARQLYPMTDETRVLSNYIGGIKKKFENFSEYVDWFNGQNITLKMFLLELPERFKSVADIHIQIKVVPGHEAALGVYTDQDRTISINPSTLLQWFRDGTIDTKYEFTIRQLVLHEAEHAFEHTYPKADVIKTIKYGGKYVTGTEYGARLTDLKDRIHTNPTFWTEAKIVEYVNGISAPFGQNLRSEHRANLLSRAISYRNSLITGSIIPEIPIDIQHIYSKKQETEEEKYNQYKLIVWRNIYNAHTIKELTSVTPIIASSKLKDTDKAELLSELTSKIRAWVNLQRQPPPKKFSEIFYMVLNKGISEADIINSNLSNDYKSELRALNNYINKTQPGTENIITPARRLYPMKPEEKEAIVQERRTSIIHRLDLLAEKQRLLREKEALLKGE